MARTVMAVGHSGNVAAAVGIGDGGGSCERNVVC